jgi:hypothetical protein
LLARNDELAVNLFVRTVTILEESDITISGVLVVRLAPPTVLGRE